MKENASFILGEGNRWPEFMFQELSKANVYILEERNPRAPESQSSRQGGLA